MLIHGNLSRPFSWQSGRGLMCIMGLQSGRFEQSLTVAYVMARYPASQLTGVAREADLESRLSLGPLREWLEFPACLAPLSTARATS